MNRKHNAGATAFHFLDRFCLLKLAAVFALVLFCLLPSGCFCDPCPEDLLCTWDIVYGQGYVAANDGIPHELHPLLMDVIRPDEETPKERPAVILLHGGGFASGSKEDENHVAIAQDLARRGYVCFLVQYRLTEEYPPAPVSYADPVSRAFHAAVVDAKTALRHVTVNAEAYGIDPLQTAFLGDSAGAIAALAAGLSPPERFADDGPDYPVPAENNPGVETHTVAIVNLWGSGDYFPELFTPEAPPIMTVHGALDFTVGVSLEPALNIDAWCRENGTIHAFYPVPDAGHGAWDAVVEGKSLSLLIAEFLETYMKPPALPKKNTIFQLPCQLRNVVGLNAKANAAQSSSTVDAYTFNSSISTPRRSR